MSRIPPPVPVRLCRIGALMTAAVLVMAACSSSTKSGTSAGGGTKAGTSAAATVATLSGSMGTFLTDGSGKALYMFASDSRSKSTCSDNCATYWPPLITTRAPTAAGKAVSSLLATITRSDGSKQVSYNGHPLYLFKEDTAPGDTKGQGSNNFGAKWWLLAPSGRPITTTVGGASGSRTSTSRSGGY